MANQEAQKDLSVSEAIDRFLAEKKEYLSPYTLRDYAIDLKRFVRTYEGPLQAITLSALEPFFASLVSLQPSSQARKYTALSRFLTWAQERQLLEENPMANMTPVQPRVIPPPSLASSIMERILPIIPPTQLRDRLIFRLIGEQGLRTTEVLALHVEDLNLAKRPLEILILTKGTKRKTPSSVLPELDIEIRSYLDHTGYRTGPLFRAQKGKQEVPLSTKSLYKAWQTYSTTANISLSLHALRASAVLSSSPYFIQGVSGIGRSVAMYSHLEEYRQEQKPRHFLDRRMRKERLASREDEGLYHWYLVPTYLDTKAINTGTVATGASWRYTKVMDGFCTYPLYAECPHRLVCAHCEYFISTGEVSRTRNFNRDKYLLRLLQELKISAVEYEVTRNIQSAIQQLREALADVPTPAGPTPRQLQHMAVSSEEPPALPEHEEQAATH